MSGWLALCVAGCGEVLGVNGFQLLARGNWLRGGVLTTLGFGLGLAMLHVAMQDLSMPVAYAVFTAIGTLGGVATGVLFWRERLSAVRAFWVALVVAAIIGLKTSAAS